MTNQPEHKQEVTQTGSQPGATEQQILKNGTRVIAKQTIDTVKGNEAEHYYTDEKARISDHVGNDPKTGYSIDGKYGTAKGLTLDTDFTVDPDQDSPDAPDNSSEQQTM